MIIKPHIFGSDLHYTQEPMKSGGLALFLFMETFMEPYLPILLLPFVSYYLFLSACRIITKALTDRKVVDRTHASTSLVATRETLYWVSP